MDLILNREERAVAALLAALSPEARRSLVRLSPLASIPRVRARLVIAHGAGDESIPFTESLRLAEAAGARAEVQIFRGFHHTGPESSWPSLRTGIEDGWGLLRVANSLLRE
jgi:dipeptidyl aminopeptidase/acylaminoacyl peptidase